MRLDANFITKELAYEKPTEQHFISNFKKLFDIKKGKLKALKGELVLPGNDHKIEFEVEPPQAYWGSSRIPQLVGIDFFVADDGLAKEELTFITSGRNSPRIPVSIYRAITDLETQFFKDKATYNQKYTIIICVEDDKFQNSYAKAIEQLCENVISELNKTRSAPKKKAGGFFQASVDGKHTSVVLATDSISVKYVPIPKSKDDPKFRTALHSALQESFMYVPDLYKQPVSQSGSGTDAASVEAGAAAAAATPTSARPTPSAPPGDSLASGVTLMPAPSAPPDDEPPTYDESQTEAARAARAAK